MGQGANRMVYCNGEPFKIPFSEVEPNEDGELVHGNHYFPSGFPIGGITPPNAQMVEDIVAGGAPRAAWAEVARIMNEDLSEEAKARVAQVIAESGARNEERA